MAKRDDVAIEALRQGIRIEEDGLRFYVQAADRTGDPLGKEMFSALAEMERMHYHSLKRQLDSVTGGKGWQRVIEPPKKRIDESKPLIPPTREEMKKAVRADAGDLDALHFGLELENNAHNLYRQAAAKTTDPVGKEMYEYLAAWEHDHFNLLMLNYEHLANVGRFYGWEKK